MNENLSMFSHCLKFHQIIYDTTASMHQQVLTKKDKYDVITMSSAGNEYVISTWLASTIP